jgi:hypothetical protein
MKDPIIMKDGQTYEREAIDAFLARSPVSPITRLPLCMSDAVQNCTLKRLIDKIWSKMFTIKIRYRRIVGISQLEMNVCRNQTIANLKSQITDVTGIPVAQQTLKFVGVLLNDESTIYESGIEEEESVRVICGKLHVIIKEASTRITTLKVHPFRTGLFLKREIQAKQGWPPDVQILTYQGKLIQDGEPIAQHHVVDGATICVSRRPLGEVRTN